ncbi:Putative coenzyme F420-dependent oxidoreductase [Halioglobus japonicus]|nr:Putative coenzyme F420-dependent oxidoreductase [Halioglobus japonicus]
MTLEKRIAVTLPAGPKLEQTVELIRWAEDNGISDGWFADAGAPDSLTQVAAIAHHTRKMRIGVAVTPVYTRTPAVLAATADVISQVLPGRFIMGLGSSSETIMGGWHGIPLDKPLTRVKETTIMVRSMLKGEKSNFALDTLHSKGYRQAPCENPPPIYLAGLRANMLETAADVGDGVIINLWPQGALPKMLEHIRIGAERAGKRAEDVEVVNRAMVLVTDDKALGRNIFRAAFGPYYATPVYNKFLAWAGYEDAAATIREGWAAKDREKTAAAMSDEMIDEIAVIGTAEEVQDRIRADAHTGVHTQIIAPMAATAEDAMRTFSAFTSANFSF